MKRTLLLAATGLLMLVAPAWPQPPGGGDQANALVQNWYRRFLHRTTDFQGMEYWSDQVRQGIPPQEVLAHILESDEYYLRAGNSPEKLVRNLFNDLLDRDPTGYEMLHYARVASESRYDAAYELLAHYPDSWQGPETWQPPAPPEQLYHPDRYPYRHHDRDYRPLDPRRR